LQDWLPAKTLNRRKKGFGIPLARWLRHWSHPDLGVMGTSNRAGLELQALEVRWRRHAQGRSDERLLLFVLLAFLHHLQGVGSSIVASEPTAGNA
jgi:asparagine synthase (glutamine-hydrolysing)